MNKVEIENFLNKARELTPEQHMKFSGATDLKDYSAVAMRIYENRIDVLDELIMSAQTGVASDMMKKQIMYGLDPKSQEFLTGRLKAALKLEDLSEKICHKTDSEFLKSEEFARLFHYVVGIHTESNEMIEALLKAVASDGKVDLVNLSEEVGDIMWYISRLNSFTKQSLGKQMLTNIRKLFVRFADGFSEHFARNRNLEDELKVLSDGVDK